MEEFVMNEMHILLVALVMYVICMYLSIQFSIKWLFVATSVLWFIPIILIDNLFIIVFSVIMIIVTFVITFFNERDGDIF